MKFRFSAFLLVLALTVPVLASDVVTYESLTIAAVSVGLSDATLNPSGKPPIQKCYGRLETGEVRYRWDGVAPTAAEGTLLSIGDILTIGDPVDALAVRFIRTGATSGVLKVTCWR